MMQNTRIDFLIKCYQTDDLGEDDHTELLQLLSLEENKVYFDQFFAEAWNDFKHKKDIFSEEQSKTVLSRLISTSKRNDIKQQKLRIIRWIGFSVAATLLLALGFIFYFHRVAPANLGDQSHLLSKTDLSDLDPGGNHAILTLADHTKIVLDDALTGTLANRDGLIITQNISGELTFGLAKTENTADEPVFNTLTTPKGGQYKIILSDGTQVWLNAETSFTFPSFFKGVKRQVKLEGEAYFEVVKNKQMPFFVDAGVSSIEVLGTHFNISAYADEQVSKTTLVEGSVKVSISGSSKIIKPGQQALTSVSSNVIRLDQIDPDEVLAWKNGFFVFSDESIHSIMKKLGRWYNFETEYQNEGINENFAGTISRYKSLSEVLKIFQATGTIHFKINNGDATGTGRRVVVMK